MSGLDVESVLAAHVYELEHRRGSICLCKFVPTVNPATLATQQDYHRAHVAAVLREQIAAAQAEAWERCSREFALNALNSATHEAALRSLRANPYRAALVAPSRVPGEES